MPPELEAILAQQPIFKGLTARHLEIIAERAALVQFDAEELILRENDIATAMYVIHRGHVALQLRGTQSGTIRIQTIGQGEVLGWSWLFPPYKWHFDAVAAEPTEAIAVSGEWIRDRCEDDHDFGYTMTRRFARIMMERLQATRVQLRDLHDPCPERP